jgi:hypothetical protein
MRWPFLLALLPTLALAQSPTPRPEDLGTVTGHITCADTQRPARFAQVSLTPIKISTEETEGLSPTDPGAVGPVHTDLTGAYALTSVPPGQYYLRVDLYGYATPIAQFTTDELKAPTPETQQRIQRAVQIINVAPNSTTEADVTLRRSGSISGTITYDDGSPVINTGIAVARRDANGNFPNPVRIPFLTGSHGEYEIQSLSAGEYVVQVTLQAIEQRMGLVISVDGKPQNNKLAEEYPFSLPVYSSSAFRSKDAAIIKVEDGQETADVNLTIPLSRLHEVSGTLLAKDGHAINEGRIELLFPDTQEQLGSVLARSDGTFRIPYVPDGEYIIRVTGAGDKTQTEGSTLTDPAAGFRIGNRITHTYGTLQQPLTVHTDIQSLNLTVPDKPTPTTPSE